jgi:acetolactate synthase-1/2/3 large subunit
VTTRAATTFAETLKSLGIRYVFGVPSGAWIDYMEAIRETDGIEFILVGNEASGGFMADACWRLTGTMAACFGTFGPGACNLTTGVCCGFLDRSPMLAFTDEMNDRMRPRTTQMNIDHQALFAPITKWTTRFAPGRISETLCRAVEIAMSEVPGPVHIGIPAGEEWPADGEPDVLRKPIPRPTGAAPREALDAMTAAFQKSEKPVVVLGCASIRAGIQPLVKKFVEKFRLPVVLTPMAKGMLPEDHPSYAGVLAHALADRVGETHQQADLVIGIGYDPVEINYEDWMPDVPLIHISTMPADLDRECFGLAGDVVGDPAAALEHLMATNAEPKKWDFEQLAARRASMFQQLAAPDEGFDPRTILEDLRSMLPADGIMTCDVGAHLHLIGQQWKTPAPDLQLMTNGCSSMGYGIPAAIAAKLCRPEAEVCCVTGDGGFLMMAGEMATAMRLGKRIIFVLLTDKSLSLIRIKQNKKTYPTYGTPLHGESYTPATNFFGVPVLTAMDRMTYRDALSRAFDMNGPVIVEAFVDAAAYDELILRGNR